MQRKGSDLVCRCRLRADVVRSHRKKVSILVDWMVVWRVFLRNV